MGIGFTPNAGQYVANSGYGWLYYQGLGAPYPNIQIFTGSANGGSVGQVYFAGLENPNVNFDASLPTTFRYTYSASAKTLSITAENGTRSSTLLNNLDVSSVPLSGFSNFALQFQGQTLDSDSNPSFVERLQVEIIPANQKPVISPAQTFSVSENSAVGFAVGTLSASDADSNPLSGWTILSGNSSGAFALDSSTGQLTVLGNLNYEATPLYTLSITVSDGTATSDPVDVTVNVLNMPEYSDVFASADPAADANQDGISNLMAYALGATSSSSRVASPGLILSPSNLTLTALVRTNDPKLTVWGNVTTNLNNWPTNTFAGTPTADQSGAVPGVTQRQEFSVPRGTDPKLFLRLKANLNP